MICTFLLDEEGNGWLALSSNCRSQTISGSWNQLSQNQFILFFFFFNCMCQGHTIWTYNLAHLKFRDKYFVIKFLSMSVYVCVILYMEFTFLYKIWEPPPQLSLSWLLVISVGILSNSIKNRTIPKSLESVWNVAWVVD